MSKSILDLQQYKGQDNGTHKIVQVGRKSKKGHILDPLKFHNFRCVTELCQKQKTLLK